MLIPVSKHLIQSLRRDNMREQRIDDIIEQLKDIRKKFGNIPVVAYTEDGIENIRGCYVTEELTDKNGRVYEDNLNKDEFISTLNVCHIE